jgi:hypothetical protein
VIAELLGSWGNLKVDENIIKMDPERRGMIICTGFNRLRSRFNAVIL